MSFLFVFLGGGLGSLGRYGTGLLAKHFFGAGFPLGTLAVNLLGCFAIGFLTAKFGKIAPSEELRNFLIAGMMGGFTTFSAFGLDSLLLFREGSLHFAILNVVLNVCLGLLLVWTGFAIAK
ncbi:putative fluoride ion transporter CrcB [Fibrobacterales bacterium]|nr:putative fluoride ion transporter CrcB [Fibrobacterales bacterium]